MKKTIIMLGSLLLVAIAAAVVFALNPKRAVAPADRQLPQAASGSTTAAAVSGPENPYPDLIQVASPKPGARVSSTSPLVISGSARGSWYFEATFPIYVVDWDGRIIGGGAARAQGDWMMTGFVPFTATITFTKPDYGARGAVILRNSNPSGDPKNAKAVEIPIEFK